MAKTLKLISWNVNGIRAVLNKGFLDFIKQEDPDIFCLQETKAEQGQAVIDLPQYEEYWNSSKGRKGYSGTAIFTKTKPLSVTFDMGIKEHDNEGRVIALEYDRFIIVTVYTPNSQRGLERLEYRQQWDKDFLAYIKKLESKKPVIFCGDLNVAHKEIDIARPKQNTMSAGFTKEERSGFDNIVAAGFIDTFRFKHPDEPDHYTWWSYFGNARGKNVGWRIDYFCVSASLQQNIQNATIFPDIHGSDHCPVGLEMTGLV
jgi:exodeoxyribonuclease-3